MRFVNLEIVNLNLICKLSWNSNGWKESYFLVRRKIYTEINFNILRLDAFFFITFLLSKPEKLNLQRENQK